MRNHIFILIVRLAVGAPVQRRHLRGAAHAGEDPRTIVDRVYSVAQAERGEQRFKVSCSSCHTPSSFGGGTFAERWDGQTMAEVFDYVSNAMPENDPGGLKKDEYADRPRLYPADQYVPGRQ